MRWIDARRRVVWSTLLAALLAIGCSDDARRAVPLPPGAVVVALGDSLTFGTGATPDTSYPSELARVSGWRIVNAGVPGDTAAQGCARLPALLDEHRPRLVIALLGGNDFLRRMPEAGVATALAQCVRDARASEADIVLVAVPRLGWSGVSNADVYARVASEHRVLAVDAGLADLLRMPSMRADNVHLNASGYREMASRIAAELRKSGHLAR